MREAIVMGQRAWLYTCPNACGRSPRIATWWDEAEALCQKLVGGELVECSLSMKILMYQALINTDAEQYRQHILSEIRANYTKMLDAGSTTVWETIEGASAFAHAGSLCHGWSAVPVYIYHKLGIAKNLAQ